MSRGKKILQIALEQGTQNEGEASHRNDCISNVAVEPFSILPDDQLLEVINLALDENQEIISMSECEQQTKNTLINKKMKIIENIELKPPDIVTLQNASFSDPQYTSAVSEVYPGTDDCFEIEHLIYTIGQNIEQNTGNEAVAKLNHMEQEAEENINSENESKEDQAKVSQPIEEKDVTELQTKNTLINEEIENIELKPPNKVTLQESFSDPQSNNF